MKKTTFAATYESPKTDFIHVESEGILCESDVWGVHEGFEEEDEIPF